MSVFLSILVLIAFVFGCIHVFVRDNEKPPVQKQIPRFSQEKITQNVTPESIVVMIESQHQVLKDSLHLIDNSCVLKTVINRIEFVQDVLPRYEAELEPYKKYPLVCKALDAYLKIFDDVSGKEDALIKSAIFRAFKSEAEKIKKLKTLKGRRERANRLAYEMIEISPEHTEFIMDFLKSLQDEIEKSS